MAIDSDIAKHIELKIYFCLRPLQTYIAIKFSSFTMHTYVMNGSGNFFKVETYIYITYT